MIWNYPRARDGGRGERRGRNVCLGTGRTGERDDSGEDRVPAGRRDGGSGDARVVVVVVIARSGYRDDRTMTTTPPNAGVGDGGSASRGATIPAFDRRRHGTRREIRCERRGGHRRDSPNRRALRCEPTLGETDRSRFWIVLNPRHHLRTTTPLTMAPKKAPAKKKATAVKGGVAKKPAAKAEPESTAEIPKGGVLIEACKS